MSTELDTRVRPYEYLAWYGGSWTYTDPDDEPATVPEPPPVERPRRRQRVTQAEFGREEPPGTGKGVVLGRFLPPHRGHEYLVRFAGEFAGNLHLLVRIAPDDPIPGELRTAWLRELFPTVTVVPVEGAPAPPDLSDLEALPYWEEVISRHAGRPDYVFASESYGEDLARRLGARYVPVDPERQVVPISGTQIREDPGTHWSYLPPCVRPYYVRRIGLIGPESTGKTTLARRLAAHFETAATPEYARVLCSDRDWEPQDTQDIARGQRAAERSLSRQANRLLFCDTDLLAIRLWSERLFGDAPDWLRKESRREPCHFYLLSEDDVAYAGDPRYDEPEERRAHFERCREELTSRSLPYAQVSGGWQVRFDVALDLVEGFLRDGR